MEQKDYIKKAITLAKEGGYKLIPAVGDRIIMFHIRRFGRATATKMWQAFIFLDPKFWQALGKSLGWSEEMELCFGCGVTIDKKEQKTMDGKHSGICGSDIEWWITWKFQQHLFLDRIQDGKSPESFFKSLINNNG